MFLVPGVTTPADPIPTDPDRVDLSACGDPRIHTFGVVLEAMARLGRLFDRSMRQATGLSTTLFEGLLRIERSGGEMSMGALTDQVALTSGGATRLVDKLAANGYVSRRQCTEDRRVQYVAITPAGRDVLGRSIEVHLRDLDQHFTGHMTESERQTLVTVFERFR